MELAEGRVPQVSDCRTLISSSLDPRFFLTLYITVLVCYGYTYPFPLSREHFGNDVVNIEEGKKENRSAFAKFLSMADFLDVSTCMRQS